VRAYATNSVGTSYGNQESFTTLGSQNPPCMGTPTVVYGGKTCHSVQIGSQCWFKENMNVEKMVSGNLEQANNNIFEKYCINDIESNCDVYGGLYQWSEMMKYVNMSGATGICPVDWQIPTHEEWLILTTYLGGNKIASGNLKEGGTIHWSSPNNDATNESGFTVLPGGSRDLFPPIYSPIGISEGFWTSSACT
jgi:uncharacterized protein (TIGR02145 family)